MEQELTVNKKSYRIVRLLGKGKGGYSYLAECDGQQAVIKQIHHEPCDYYTFGNKIEAEPMSGCKTLASVYPGCMPLTETPSGSSRTISRGRL